MVYKKIINICVVIAILLTMMFLGINIYFYQIANKKTNDKSMILEIPYGSSLKKVVGILYKNGLLNDGNDFYIYVRYWRKEASKIQAGFYEFTGSLSYKELAERLLFGKDLSFRVTIKEGSSLVDIVNTLKGADLILEKDFIEAMRSKEVLEKINAPNALDRETLVNGTGGIEGYLFPDTYFFGKKALAKDIILSMHKKLLSVFDKNMAERMAILGMNFHEVLTLASIIEKETGAKFERPIISSVYHNRLHKGMRFQADPTVIYGIKNYDGKIHKSDLLSFHEYNTYKIKGLPKGPIASPGLESIKAALWPDNSKFLYFVSKNDGSHEFCENLSCHNKAVKKWQIDYFKMRAAK